MPHVNPSSAGNTDRVVHVGLTQMTCGDDSAANLARQVALVEQAAGRGAQIICTQELFRSKYFCQLEDHRFFKLAESIPGPSTDALCKVAKARGVVIIVFFKSLRRLMSRFVRGAIGV